MKLVKRYRCDFCKKALLNKPGMERHEKHCTGNPNRVCRMCIISGHSQESLTVLVTALGKCTNDLKPLREAANDCPACMLAAVRQFQKDRDEGPYMCAWHFDFKAELKAFWEEKRSMDKEDCSYA